MRPPTIPTTIPVNRDDSKQVVIMKSLYNSLIEYREPKTHRILIQLFMCLPSRKDFPEYFDIIEKPIAMNKIRERIERQQYPDEEACMDDFKLMFRNCQFFNEDDSQIYKDALTLKTLLNKRREQLLNEHNRQGRDSSKGDADEVASNSTTTAAAAAPTTTDHQTSNNFPSPNIKTERLNNHSSLNNHATPNVVATNLAASSTNNGSTRAERSRSDNGNDNSSLNKNDADIGTHNTNHNSTSNHPNQNLEHVSNSSVPTVSSMSSNVASNDGSSTNNDLLLAQSDSTNQSTTEQQNGGDEMNTGNLKVNHNHHNEASMDSSSNLSADLLASTPIEKCSLNTRRGRNSDAPKRQLLTGYIIYASEIRKQVIDKNPNQNFGDISRLVGNEWKALPHDIRSKYDQRALIHNKRVRERAQRELHAVEGRLANGLHTPKLTKRKLAKLAKEQMRQHHLSIQGLDDSLTHSPKVSQEHSTTQPTPSSTHKQLSQNSHPQPTSQATSSKAPTVESSTQTIAIRFVQPPTKKRLVYSDTFKKYIESLQVQNKDLLVEETTPDRPAELPTHWLGNGAGRHESPEAALWALRDFMLQDAVTMRKSMEPYL